MDKSCCPLKETSYIVNPAHFLFFFFFFYDKREFVATRGVDWVNLTTVLQIHSPNYYRPSIMVTVTWLMVHVSSCLPECESPSWPRLPRQYPGTVGCGIDTKSLLNINTTVDMFGLSSAGSCTHRSPTCMHLITSLGEYDSPTAESKISNPLPSLYSFQACRRIN